MRKRIKKWVFGSCPGLAGQFKYFGTTIYFPHGSWAFTAACEQGVFEADNVKVLCSQVIANTVIFDIGCNIGLMAVPLLARFDDISVVSFEPSPNNLPYLRKTIERSRFASRWMLIEKAASDHVGTANFHLAAAHKSFFDGLQDTKRVDIQDTIEVEVTTVDDEWKKLGKPAVSLIKCDIEGGELNMLKGAMECIKQCSPSILVEWNQENLNAYGVEFTSLISIAEELSFDVFSVPCMSKVSSSRNLLVNMAFSESFILLPRF